MKREILELSSKSYAVRIYNEKDISFLEKIFADKFYYILPCNTKKLMIYVYINRHLQISGFSTLEERMNKYYDYVDIKDLKLKYKISTLKNKNKLILKSEYFVPVKDEKDIKFLITMFKNPYDFFSKILDLNTIKSVYITGSTISGYSRYYKPNLTDTPVMNIDTLKLKYKILTLKDKEQNNSIKV